MKRIIGASLTDEISELEKENSEVAYRAALESIVLLKNDGCLPLKEKEVGLFGVGAAHTIKGGTGSGEVNNRHSISVLEGFLNSGLKISSLDYLKEYDVHERKCHEQFIKENKKLKGLFAFGHDYVLPPSRVIRREEVISPVNFYVLSRQAGESKDRRNIKGDFKLLDEEENDIKTLSECGEHVVLVINCGGPVDLSNIEDIENLSIIFMGQCGQEGGRALADLVNGKCSFSGRLTCSWPLKYEDLPFFSEYSNNNGDLKNEYYKEGIYVGYRYYDSFDIKPRFPFGFGLSYGEFKLKLKDFKYINESVRIKVEVENISDFPAKEIVQIYVHCPKGKIHKEFQRLVAFNKTGILKKNETEVLDFDIPVNYLCSYFEEDATTRLEAGSYVFRIGKSSRDLINDFVLRINDELCYAKHVNVCPALLEIKELESDYKDICADDLPVLEMGQLRVIEYKYPKLVANDNTRVLEVLNSLKTTEMLKVVSGIGHRGMFDTNAHLAPGSAGKTDYTLIHKGIGSINLADGPAGLRLIQKFALSKKGGLKMFPGHYLLGFMEVLPDYIFLPFKPKEKDVTYYQFTTAFPCGSALAQSFNLKLVEEVGYAVSKEMSKYNITYWLAPGMNIMKNPLCGRNFEYYSEDPLLSGKISAAMTLGVQKIKGHYTTIKHFACNNTEENRMYSNSHVKERTLREIYLKGFEINIKEARSKGLMTSYNLINGIYASDNYDLNTKVLRNEWNFDGVIMTDWSSTARDRANNVKTIKSGNDLIMPGGFGVKLSLLIGLLNKKLSMDELRLAAYNNIKNILESEKD